MTSDPFNAAVSTRPTPTGQTVTAAVQSIRGEQTSGAEEPRALRQVSESAASKPGTEGRTPAETAEQVKQAVEQINEMMQSGQQSLRFAVDDDSGRTVVRVMDAQTDEVIRQIPTEETLRFAEYVDGLVGMIFNKKA